MKIVLIIIGCLIFLWGLLFLTYKILYFIARFVLITVGQPVGLVLQEKARIDKEAWEYWERMKGRSWRELTDDEKETMVDAAMIINADCGACVSEERTREMLKEQLPITEPHVGLTYR